MTVELDAIVERLAAEAAGGEPGVIGRKVVDEGAGQVKAENGG